MSRLENWYVGPDDRLFGQVYDDHRWPDGTEIVTSRVVEWDSETKTARTKNTGYILGEPLKKIGEQIRKDFPELK